MSGEGKSFNGAIVETDGHGRREKRPEKGGPKGTRVIEAPRKDRKHRRRQWDESEPQIEPEA